MPNAAGLAYTTPQGKKYDAYINSKEWASKRAEYWGRYGRSCKANLCDATTDLHVHHHTYERLGNELLSDLVGLCRAHHEEVHARHDASGRKESLTRVTELVTGLDLRSKSKSTEAPKRSRKKAGVKKKTLRRLEELHFRQPPATPCSCRTCQSRAKAKVGKRVGVLDTVGHRERQRLVANREKVRDEKRSVLKASSGTKSSRKAARKASEREKAMERRAAQTRAHAASQEVARRIAEARQK